MCLGKCTSLAWRPGDRREAYGATPEVLKWVREGGCTIRVDECGRGIFKRNGKNARQNNEALVVLVLELLMKKLWEVARQDALLNVISIGLAPKPQWKGPPLANHL